MKSLSVIVYALMLVCPILTTSAVNVLLIPESSNDTVGMYDPVIGTYLGDFIPGYAGFSTPINAIQGPDGNIYVSDQVADSVYVFDVQGTYLSTYADATDGLNNIRGIDFRGDHLFVTSGDQFVAEFSAPHTRLTDFISDGSDPFDILFLADDTALMSDIVGTTDNVRLYNADGTFNRQIFADNFPEQIVSMISTGDFLSASFSNDLITRFDLDGVISTVPFDSGRGIYELENGNWIATNGNGVFEIDPSTGAIITTLRSGVSGRFIELADVDIIMEPTPTPTMVPTATPELPTATPEPTQTPTAECIHHGDVNGSGDLTAGDAQLAFLIVLGSYSPTYVQECAADCNADGDITAGDAQAIFLAVLSGTSCADPLT